MHGWADRRVFESIKMIYAKLGDNVSKNIFMKRLQFSLTEDSKYIEEMVRSEMGRYGGDDIMNRLVEWIDKEHKPVAIFGAGGAGIQIAGGLLAMGRSVACFFDNNPQLHGNEIMGLKICAPDTLAEEKDCRVIIGSNFYVAEIEEQLLQMGIDRRQIFVPEKMWWLGNDGQYFDRDIMRPHAGESFIDGGALDGEDSVKFVQWCNGDYDVVYMFEPDADNRQKLASVKAMDERIVICEEGLWSGSGEVSFQAGKKESSAIVENGNTMIRVTSIDETLKGKPVTVIKLDIEGSEMKALEGAENTIRKWKPRLAICVYHKLEDIVDIPLKILEINPEYSLYLRHYSYLHTETVLYAV